MLSFITNNTKHNISKGGVHMNPIIYIVAAGIIVAIGLIVGFNITKNKYKKRVKNE